jgi:hypothetical protein
MILHNTQVAGIKIMNRTRMKQNKVNKRLKITLKKLD